MHMKITYYSSGKVALNVLSRIPISYMMFTPVTFLCTNTASCISSLKREQHVKTITKTRQCNILQIFTAVKNDNFQMNN